MIFSKEECDVPLSPPNGPVSAPPPLDDRNDQLKLHVEAQQKIITDQETKLSNKEEELSHKVAELNQKDQVLFFQYFHLILELPYFQEIQVLKEALAKAMAEK